MSAHGRGRGRGARGRGGGARREEHEPRERGGGVLNLQERVLHQFITERCSLSNESDAARFLQAASQHPKPRDALYLIASSEGLEILDRTIDLLSAQHLASHVIPFCKFLLGDECFCGGSKKIVEDIFLRMTKLPGLTKIILRAINDNILNVDALETIADMFCCLATASEEMRRDKQVVATASALRLRGAGDALHSMIAGSTERASAAPAAPSGAARPSDGKELSVPLMTEMLRLSTPGGRHDNDAVNFRDIQPVPTAEEVQCGEKAYLPLEGDPSNPLANNPHAMYLDRHVRWLREDMMAGLREEFRERDPRNTYPSVRFMGLAGIRAPDDKRRGGPTCERLSVRISVRMPEPVVRRLRRDDRGDEFWRGGKGRHVLGQDALVCIDLGDGAPRGRRILLGVIVKRFVETFDRVKDNARFPEIGIHFPHRKDLEWALEHLPAALAQLPRAVLIQSTASFFAYEPIISCLQRISEVPFEDEILHGIWDTDPPAYTRTLDWRGALARQAMRLDETQTAAVERAMSQRVVCIQGPPGTGKTVIGAALAQIATGAGGMHVLALCETNHALDNFCEDLLDRGITRLVRLGSEAKVSEKVRPYMLHPQKEKFDAMQNRRFAVLKSEQETVEKKINDLVRLLSYTILGKGRFCFNHLREYLQLYDRAALAQLEAGYDEEFEEDGHNVARLWDAWIDGHAGEGALFALSRAEREAKRQEWSDIIYALARPELITNIRKREAVRQHLEALQGESTLTTLQRAQVVACTTTYANKYRRVLEDLRCGVVIVEEAGETLESHVIGAVNRHVQHLIMIGDHKQLRPKVENYELTVEAGNGYTFNVSLFERLATAHPDRISILATQHRMRPEISAIIRGCTYPQLEDAAGVLGREPMRGFTRSVVFMRHTVMEGQAGERELVNDKTKVNDFEATMAVRVVAYLMQQGYQPNQIVLLTPYVGQLLCLRTKLMERRCAALVEEMDRAEVRRARLQMDNSNNNEGNGNNGGNQPARPTIRVATVDNYQGEESDIVILSLVRSNTAHNTGFVSGPERTNVALSRAKKGMIILGNAETLLGARKNREPWYSVLQIIARTGYVGNGLPLRCATHGTEQLAATAADFDAKSPAGGCGAACGQRLGCGHPCPLRCHLDVELRHREQQATCRVRVPERCNDGHAYDRVCNQQRECPTCGELRRIAREQEQERVRLQREHERLRQAAQQQQLTAQEANRQAQLKLRHTEERLREERATQQQIADAEAAIAQQAMLERERPNIVAADVAARRAENEARLRWLEAQARAEREATERENAARLARIEADTEAQRQRLEAERVAHQRNAAQRLAQVQARADAEVGAAEAAAREQRDALARQEQARAAEMQAAAAAHVRNEQREARVLAAEMRRLADAGAEARARLDADPAAFVRARVDCAICMESHPRVAGITCAVGHYTCQTCFENDVRGQCEADADIRRAHNGRIRCALRGAGGCASEPYAEVDVAAALGDNPELFARYHEQILALREADIAAEMEGEMVVRLQAEVRRIAEMDERGRRVDTAVMHVREEILNLKCPRCRRVFLEFDGCFALTCGCGCGFCAWCLMDCGGDAHGHVAACPESNGRNVYGTFEQFTTHHRQRNAVRVREYVLAIADEAVRREVVAQLAADLRDHRMDELAAALGAVGQIGGGAGAAPMGLGGGAGDRRVGAGAAPVPARAALAAAEVRAREAAAAREAQRREAQRREEERRNAELQRRVAQQAVRQPAFARMFMGRNNDRVAQPVPAARLPERAVVAAPAAARGGGNDLAWRANFNEADFAADEDIDLLLF